MPSDDAPSSSLDRQPSDIELARNADLRPIEDVAMDLGLGVGDIEPRGNHVVKLTPDAVSRLTERPRTGHLILVTGITPTPMGEGKTVTTVGIGQALGHLGERSAVAIREPSLGPVFGTKGGAAGGGYAQVLPMEDINLHFTGDIHAVTAAHNLVAAQLDAHVHHGNDLDVDVRRVTWPRATDTNDRALRETVVGLGGTTSGVPREDRWVITAASELMAVLGMASDLADLRARVARIVVAYDHDGDPVTVDDLGVAGAVAATLRDALRPNLVQTMAGTPAFVHGGPFANIAHGTNTLVTDRVALSLADFVVTEAGFGADLGAEKFVNIVSRHDVAPDAVVLVATIRALKAHGHGDWPVDVDALRDPDPTAVRDGLANLDRHVDVLEGFGLPVAVAVNRFPADTDEEVAEILDHCRARDVPAAVSTAHAQGAAGATDLARIARDLAVSGRADVTPTYDVTDSIEAKVDAVARDVYGATGTRFTDDALADVARLEEHGLADVPVCLSKTPYSFSDDPTKRNAPENFEITVREVYPAAGAGFVVALTGDVMTMPGLRVHPAAEDIDVTPDGDITGLF